MYYGPLSYYRLGAVYPRSELRRPYPERGREFSTRRARELVVLGGSPIPPPPVTDINVLEFDAPCRLELDFTGGSAVGFGIDPHVGDVGTRVKLRLIDEQGGTINVSAASLLEVRVKNAGVVQSYTGLLFTDGTDGIVYFLTTSATWTNPGNWQVQAHAVVGAREFRSRTNQFYVAPNL